MIFFFFFSSRRRHTRWNCDWSSDVCSSDLSRMLGVSHDDLTPETLAATLDRLRAEVTTRGTAVDGFRDRVEEFVHADPGDRVVYVNGAPPHLAVIDGQGNHDAALARTLAADRDLADRINRGAVTVEYYGALVGDQGAVHLV